MLRAGTLLYALFIALLIAFGSGALIFFAYFSRVAVQSSIRKEKVLLNVESGINILLAHPDNIPFSLPTPVSLFGDSGSTVELQRTQWGAFEIVVSSARAGNFSFSQTALIGSVLSDDNRIALYLTDLDKPLSVCGNTHISGLCYLPEAGVKRAYIEGQSFTGEKLIDGEVRKSKTILPPAGKELIEQNKNYLQGATGKSDSLAEYKTVESFDSLTRSFSENTMVLHSEEKVMLTGKFIRGNIRVFSKTGVFVGAGCQLNDIIIYAPYIEIESGFKGSLQLFASDSVVIGENCRLNYPSLVGLIQSEISGKSFITLKKESRLSGVLFAISAASGQKNPVRLLIEKDAMVTGQIYANGVVDLKGTVHGTIACDQFILITPSSVYENHLFNAVIDYPKLSPHFAGVWLTGYSGIRKIVKWLN